ncbi:hypothetical protein ADJ73_08275 [Arsenicicoccus sp. oral taxon 190]|nr:hypothetical protein ADJ73_08275 [Arsenicicoccus sp. oral taxon 190]
MLSWGTADMVPRTRTASQSTSMIPASARPGPTENNAFLALKSPKTTLLVCSRARTRASCSHRCSRWCRLTSGKPSLAHRLAARKRNWISRSLRIAEPVMECPTCTNESGMSGMSRPTTRPWSRTSRIGHAAFESSRSRSGALMRERTPTMASSPPLASCPALNSL